MPYPRHQCDALNVAGQLSDFLQRHSQPLQQIDGGKHLKLTDMVVAVLIIPDSIRFYDILFVVETQGIDGKIKYSGNFSDGIVLLQGITSPCILRFSFLLLAVCLDIGF